LPMLREILSSPHSCGLADAARSGHVYHAIRGRCCLIGCSGPAQISVSRAPLPPQSIHYLSRGTIRSARSAVDIPLQARPRSTDRTRLRPQSPKNGNFSNIRQRLSAILLRNSPKSVPGDPPLIHKTPLLAGLSGIDEGKVSRRWTGWLAAQC
jgi:hypothetical protein